MTKNADHLAAFNEENLEFLRQYRFDPRTFSQLVNELQDGKFTKERNYILAKLERPDDRDVIPWPTAESDAEKIGQRAIDEGKVGAVILNGGMATRFGGVVKGVVEALPGQSFLNLKLQDINQFDGKVSIFLMNSFATQKDTHEHLKGSAAKIHTAMQGISARVTPDGHVFRSQNGNLSYYAPGHGDIFSTVAACEDFNTFRAGGGCYLHVSNVDNLAATLSPRVIGAHILAGKEVTVEVAPRYPGDKGGAPVKVDGRVAIVEGFRFPKTFDHESLAVFNTNTMVMNAEVFASDPPLTWFRADKEVEGQKVVQFERLMGEITSFASSAFLSVPREGPEGRFLPVKTPADLQALQGELQERFPS